MDDGPFSILTTPLLGPISSYEPASKLLVIGENISKVESPSRRILDTYKLDRQPTFFTVYNKPSLDDTIVQKVNKITNEEQSPIGVVTKLNINFFPNQQRQPEPLRMGGPTLTKSV